MLNMTAKTQRHKSNRKGTSTSGISIIEVLVAIAILTIGMLAILLLFPAGLIAIGTAANSTNADRLGQAELEKAMASQVQLISAIYSNDDTTANVNPTSLLQNAGYEISSTAPGYIQNPNTNLAFSNGTDVDAFRSIKGETIRVPSLNAAGLSLYTVIAGPIEEDSPSTLQVNGAAWQGISGDSTSTANDYLDPGSIAAGQPEYLIDYANGEICISAEPTGSTPYDQPIIFTVTDAAGVTTTQAITVPQGSCGQWVLLRNLMTTGTTPIAATEGALPWQRSTDTLVRNFQLVGTPGALSAPASTASTLFTSDPFQYQIYLPDYVASSPSASSPSANLGVIAFNPKASFLHGGNGQPLEAVLNYKTYDWHIISEDRLITSQTATTRLSLVNILAAGANDKLTDNSTKYTGLFTFSGVTTPADPDFIILDMDTGVQLVPGTDYSVNYPDGAVSFLGTGTNNYANDHLRLFYHPADDWAVALARAPVVYGMDQAAADLTNLTPALSTYVPPLVSGTTPVTSTSTPASTDSIIYFPLVDEGKQVDIRYSYNTTSGSTVTTEGLFTLAANGTNSKVDLNSPALDTHAPAGATNFVPLSVKGASLSAIVIWNTNSAWHTRIISTVLTPQSQFSQTSLQ
jgi:Tfp pilus assembly protein PilV